MPAEEVEFYWPQIWYVRFILVGKEALIVVI